MRHVATNVREAVVVGSGHWLMEERPVETVALLEEVADVLPDGSGWAPEHPASSRQPAVRKMAERNLRINISAIFFHYFPIGKVFSSQVVPSDSYLPT